MSDDPRSLAKPAREELARGLGLLQDPNLPAQFMSAAEPIARAMSLLLQIERSDGAPATAKPLAEQALAALRDALGRLQTITTDHPAGGEALAVVAGALAAVHKITRIEAAAAPAPPAAPPASPSTSTTSPSQPAVPLTNAKSAPRAAAGGRVPQNTNYQVGEAMKPPSEKAPAAARVAGTQQEIKVAPEAFAPAPQAAPQFQPPPAAPQFQPPPAPQFQPPPAAPQFHPPPAPQFQAPPAAPSFQPALQAQAAAPQFQPPPQPQAAAPQFQAPNPYPQPPPQNANPYSPTEMAKPPPPSAAGPSVPPPAGTVEAELGAHSPSNFYKTLSGNDIVEHGGIFVATYAIPKIGSRVSLRVHFPGGYQFDCPAVVRWTRDAADNPDAPPGFGAQFQGITPDQRQLVQRYVRNREPLFYDDL